MWQCQNQQWKWFFEWISKYVSVEQTFREFNAQIKSHHTQHKSKMSFNNEQNKLIEENARLRAENIKLKKQRLFCLFIEFF